MIIKMIKTKLYPYWKTRGDLGKDTDKTGETLDFVCVFFILNIYFEK